MNERDRNVRAQEAHPQHTGTATGRPDDQSCCWNCGLLNTDDAKDCLHCEAPLPGPALMAVMAERNRQDAKWGGPDHDSQLTILDWHEVIADYIRKIADNNFRPVKYGSEDCVNAANLFLHQAADLIEKLTALPTAANPSISRRKNSE